MLSLSTRMSLTVHHIIDVAIFPSDADLFRNTYRHINVAKRRDICCAQDCKFLRRQPLPIFNRVDNGLWNPHPALSSFESLDNTDTTKRGDEEAAMSLLASIERTNLSSVCVTVTKPRCCGFESRSPLDGTGTVARQETTAKDKEQHCHSTIIIAGTTAMVSA